MNRPCGYALAAGWLLLLICGGRAYDGPGEKIIVHLETEAHEKLAPGFDFVSKQRLILWTRGYLDRRGAVEGDLLFIGMRHLVDDAIERIYLESNALSIVRPHCGPSRQAERGEKGAPSKSLIYFSHFRNLLRRDYIVIIDGKRPDALDLLKLFLFIKVTGVIVLNWAEQVPPEGLDAELASDVTVVFHRHYGPDALSMDRRIDTLYRYSPSQRVRVRIESADVGVSFVTMCVIVATFLAMISATLVMYLRARMRFSDVKAVLSRKKLKEFRVARYSPELSPLGIDSCSICMESFHSLSVCRVLPCHHLFHAACVDPWLLTHSDRCPYCQKSLKVNESEEVACT